MRKLIVSLALIVITITVPAQDYSNLKAIPLNDSIQCKKAESKVVECADYLLSKPIDKDLNSINAYQFILEWMQKTPDYFFDFNKPLYKSIQPDSGLAERYLACQAKVAIIEKPKTDYSDFAFKFIKMFLQYGENFKKNVEDSIKLFCLYEISNAYKNINLDSMVFYAQQAVVLSIKNKFPAIAEADALSNLANALWYAGNYPDAMEAFFKALKKAEPVGDTLQIGSIYNGLAMVNRNEGNFRQAINYYSKAEALVKDIPDNDVLLSLLIDKGKSYEQLNILDSALTYVQACLGMYSRKYQGKNIWGGGIHAEMGIIYSKMGNEKFAAEYFKQSFQLTTEVNEPRLLARAYVEFAEHFNRNNQRDSAIYYATKGLLIDRQHGFLVQQLAASTLLTKLYTENNKIDSAFKYQRLMIETKDSVFSNEKINRLQTLEFNEQLRQQEIEASRIAAAEERKQNIQYALIALGLVIFIILFLIFSHSFIANAKLIEFFGVIALLIVFEFLNLLLHPFLERITHHSPVLMLMALVCIAGLLVPLHHKLEKWTTEMLVEKNKKIRLARAKEIVRN
jgi:tetratricopeptide (TPR) repeat protein